MQMTHANLWSYNELDSAMIFPIKNTTGGWTDGFQDIDFKNTKASKYWSVMVKTVPLDNS